MMFIARGVYSEFIRLRHTPVIWLHIILPILGAAVFLLYFALYPQVEINDKMALMLEMIAIVFPILIGVVCGMVTAIEEKNVGFQVMFCNKDGKGISYLNKLLTTILFGCFSVFVLIGMTLVGSSIFLEVNLPISRLMNAIVFLSAGIIPLYFVHFFLSIRWGIGSSVFLGVIGSLIAVLFSNIRSPLWYAFPHSWGITFMKYSIDATHMVISSNHLLIVLAISIILFIAPILWFGKWEGRKSME